MWKYKPNMVEEKGKVTFKDFTHNREGIKVNSLFSDDTETNVCCIERVLI